MKNDKTMRRRTMRSSAVWIGLLVLTVCSSLQAAPEVPAETRSYLEARLARGPATALVVGMVDAEGASFVELGERERGGAAADRHTVFEIGSISKVFTALLLEDLAREGKLELEAPVRRFLPELTGKPAGAITLEQLATHRSGLPRLPANLHPDDPADPYADYGVEDLAAFLAAYEPEREPPRAYEYSNLGMGLLGHVLGRVEQKSYDELVQRRIAEPLGMDATRIELSAELAARFATGHRMDGEPTSAWAIPTLAGAGALRSTAEDMSRFLAANLGHLETSLGAAIERTHEGRLPTGTEDLRVALGWHVWRKHGAEILWHNGGTGGFRSFAGLRHDLGIGVVVLTNAAADVDDIGLHLLEPGFELAELRRAVEPAPEILREAPGVYELAPGVRFYITEKGGALYARLTGQDTFPIYPESRTRFFYEVVEAQITFHEGSEGRITHLVLHQHGMDQKASRVAEGEEAAPARQEVSLTPEQLQALVGRYRLAPGAVFEITAEGSELFAQLTGQPRFPVYAESPVRFFYKVVEATLTFELDEEGRATALTLDQGPIHQRAPRVE